MPDEQEAVRRADDYDQLVDWDKRLAREAPLFREVFAESDARRVADVGCGSGRHALMFASWGLEVYPIDPDPAMLEQARVNARAAGIDQAFYEGGFGDVAGIVGEPVDALVCLGNALPHVDGVEGSRTALADFAAAVRPGGTIVLHLLNHDRLLAQRLRTIPPVVRDTPDCTRVFLRVLDYDEPGGIGFEFLTLTRTSPGEWETASRRSVHTALPSALLAAELAAAGFGDVALFGDHARKPFDAASDESVIVVAHRR